MTRQTLGMTSRHVSRVIPATPETVYAFAAEADNLPAWASGLAQSAVTKDGDTLVVDSPMGRVTVSFAPRNPFGILDHDVRLPTGQLVNNPVRVIAHPDGAEIVFTVRQRDLSDEQFERDVAAVQRDLDTLAALFTA